MEPPLCHLNKWRRGTGRGGTDLSISYHPAFLLLAGDSVRLRPLKSTFKKSDLFSLSSLIFRGQSISDFYFPNFCFRISTPEISGKITRFSS